MIQCAGVKVQCSGSNTMEIALKNYPIKLIIMKEGENVGMFKVSLIRLGYAIVQAESKGEASEKINTITEKGICWMTEKDGLPGPYLVTFIESADR